MANTAATLTIEPLELDAVEDALQRAVDALFAVQSPAGWWKGELQTNVTMDAEDLFLREFLGIADAAITRAAANWIRSQQRDDGTWASFHGGPPELSTTVEAYWALKLAGDPAGAPHMRRAAAFIVDAGGLERTRVFTRIWMALFGLWSWSELPALPPELMLLPPRLGGRWVPLNIYDFACWARQTVVPLTVVASFRPVRPMAVTLDELRTGATRREIEPRPRGSTAPALPAARSRPAALRASPGRPAASPRPGAGRALDHPAPGGRRQLGRHPATVGLLVARPPPPRPPGRSPGDAGRPGRPRPLLGLG